MTDLHHSTDWRDVIAQNRRRTYFVMATLVVIYMFLGLLIDILISIALVEKQMYLIEQKAVVQTTTYEELNNAEINKDLGRYYGVSFFNNTERRDNTTQWNSDIASKVQSHPNKSPAHIAAKLLLTGKLFPYATVSAGLAAFIAIFIAFIFSHRLMLLGTSYRLLTPETAQDLAETQLYNAVEEMKIAAGLQWMPMVYIIDADYMNAFASGANEKSAMIAVTRGLLEGLDRDEMQAVIAHELSHIRHQDTRLILMVSVLTNLILLAVDFLFYSFFYSISVRRGSIRIAVMVILLRYILPLVTSLLYFYLSRKRELMADAGAVELTRQNEPLARALIKIDAAHKENCEEQEEAYQQTAHEELRAAAYIYCPKAAGINIRPTLNLLFSSGSNLINAAYKGNSEEQEKAVHKAELLAAASIYYPKASDSNTRPPLSSLFSSHPDLEERLITIGYKRKRM